MGKRRRSVLGDANESDGEAPTKRACVDRWSFPDELKNATHLCQKLYDSLRRAKDEENRLLCECLVRVPSRRSHPHYYDLIKTPIDLMRIQQKLKTEEYRSVPDFLHDIRLLLENARTFFGEGSEEVNCVDQLETLFTLRLQEYAGRFVPSTSADSSPPSLTLRISKDHLQGLSASTGKTSQSGSSRPQQTQPRSKFTRSKAWLQEYLSSSDPLRMFLASVYEHTDSTGVCVAEVFHELPSSKDYPEYYEVITEPVDLNIVRRNLEEGRYSNLRDIQEDLILMIKNAHHFNEPGSDVYKFASVLRKFIIAHCAELERKYHTVTAKPLKVSLKRLSVSGGDVEEESLTGDEKKVPRLKVKIGSGSTGEVKVQSGVASEVGVKVGRRLSQSSRTPESEDESANSESSGEESSQSEEEGEGEVPRKRRRVSQGKERRDQLAKLLKAHNPPPLRKQGLVLFHHLVHHRDAQGRQTSALFMRKPSAKQYPEYYVVIQSPIDLREISQKIKQEQYGCLEDVMKDVELLVSNATTFNEEESTVYQDALTLQQLARVAANRLQAAWPHPQPHPPKTTTSSAVSLPVVATPTVVPLPRPRGRPRKHPLPPEMGGAVGGASIQSPISSLFMAIKMFTLQGRGLWRSLQNQPTVGSEVRKEFSTISMKIATGKFSSVHQLYQDLHQSLDHVCQTQPSDSLLHRDALILCRVAAKKYLELTAEERQTSLYPNIEEAVQAMLRFMLSKALQCPEADVLREMVVTREIQTDGDEPPSTHKLSLPLMEKWVERGCYQRLDSLQKDLFSILSFAAEKTPALCQSAMAVGRVFLRHRDLVVGGKGGRLASPALSLTADELERTLAGKLAFPEDQGVEPVAKAMAEKDEKEVVETGETFDRLTVSGKTYHIGDVVYLKSRNAGQKPHIVLIEKLWKDLSGASRLQGCWFYRPEETFHLATRTFYEKEVFKSDFHSVALLGEVQGSCCVLVVRDFVRSSPPDFPEDDVFVCESRYAHKAKSFKKIKNWSYPPGRQPLLIARDVPIALRRVPSVFMTQSTRVTGSGSHSVVPVSDTVRSSDKDFESYAEGQGVELSLPHPAQLENVKAEVVANPAQGCTYYQQYCIDEDRFRLGDCVYVRSDQEKPFVARIDRMWTDANGDPWFHGPWFVYPEEISHTPTRLFLERELFMSNILDTNPMRSIIGRCSVMALPDYCRKRQTEFGEDDVFVVESRYLEAEGEIRKIVKAAAALKPPQLSGEVQEDEVFFFPAEILPRKLPSPKLLLQVSSPVTISPSTANLAKQTSLSSLSSSNSPTPVPTKAPAGPLLSSLPTPPGVPQPATVANVVGINPQLLQALLASVSQASSSKPVVIPLQQSPSAGLATPTNPVQLTPTTPSQVRLEPTARSSSQLVGYICLWDECGEKFDSLTDLTTHLMLNADTTHLVREMDGNFYCRWANCPRNPRHGGRTFDAMPKITRHVKEVHLLKLSQTALGLNPRSHVIQGQVVRPPAPSPSPIPSPAISLSSIPLPSNFATVPPSLPLAHIPILTPPAVPIGTSLLPSISPVSLEAQPPSSAAAEAAPVVAVSSAQSTPAAQSDASTTSSAATPLPMSSIFVPPPENMKPILHSAIYTKYIEGLQKGTKYSSSMQMTDQMSPAHRASMTSSQVQVSDWLSPSAIPPDTSATEALLRLRDHLLRDSLRLGQHLEQFQ